MKIEINGDELESVKSYLNSLNDPNQAMFYRGRYTDEEIKQVFPVLTKIYKYAVSLEGRTEKDGVGYLYLSQNPDKPEEYKQNAIDHTDLITALIEEYEDEADAEAEDKIKSKKIIEMTGYEFEEYLYLIGLLKE